MMNRPTIALALLAAIALGACDDSDTTAPVSTAQVRVVHASPDAPNVDVLVDGAAVLTNVPFKGSSSYLDVPAGSRNLRVRAAGTSTVVIDQTAAVTAGKRYTVLATGRVASIAPLVLEDDLAGPGPGNVKLRLVHASPAAGNVDIYVTAPGASIATATPTVANVPFRGASNYLEVAAGTYRVRITPAGSKTVALDVNDVALTAGQVRTAVAVDAPGGGTPLAAIVLAERN
jgi:hypothetical protein